MGRLEGKVAFVTGAARGQGRGVDNVNNTNGDCRPSKQTATSGQAVNGIGKWEIDRFKTHPETGAAQVYDSRSITKQPASTGISGFHAVVAQVFMAHPST